MKVFVDSNIPMYVAGADHPHRAPSIQFLKNAEADGLELCTSTEVLQEILYRFSGMGRRDVGARLYDLFVALMPEVFDVTLADTDLAKTLLLAHEGISARDAVHAGVMINRDVRVMATFDRGFDDLEGITRLEPGRL